MALWEEKVLLIKEVRGKWKDWVKLPVRICNHSLQLRWAVKHLSMHEISNQLVDGRNLDSQRLGKKKTFVCFHCPF